MKSPLIAITALSLMTAGAAFAQTTPGQTPPAETPPAEATQRQFDPAEHAKRLREGLQLRADQEPALQAFITSMQQHKGDHQTMMNLPTPERLDRMSARMAEHVAATKTFYAALTPDQQKAFDAMHQEMAGKKMRGGGMGQ